MNKWLVRLLGKLHRIVPMRLLLNVRAALANQIAGIVVALFIIGAIGATAVTMASNSSAFGADVPASVVLVFTVAIPVMAGVAIMLYFLPKRS